MWLYAGHIRISSCPNMWIILKNFFFLKLFLKSLLLIGYFKHLPTLFWCFPFSFYVNVKYVSADLVERLVVCTSNPTSKESWCINSFFWSLIQKKIHLCHWKGLKTSNGLNLKILQKLNIKTYWSSSLLLETELRTCRDTFIYGANNPSSLYVFTWNS